VTRTEQEIYSQPDVWAHAFGLTEQVRELLVAPGENILAIGCGTSAFMATSYALLREASGAGPTEAVYATEISPVRRFDRLVAITRSGTTTEIMQALRNTRAAGQTAIATKTVGVTAVIGEEIDELVDQRLVLDFADEASVVQTRFPTTLLALVRAALGEDPDAMLAACRKALEQPLPADPAQFEHFVFLGSRWTLGLAHEAALKIREAAQAWSESYVAMDYRHGPIAVAGDRSLVWIFGTPPEGLVDAIRARGATVVTSELDPLAQLVMAQRLAVALAASRGLDPDHPRALSRSVILDLTA
jgi:glucosamine--fructose-6-phosphate aminotransferase (isomerizing)